MANETGGKFEGRTAAEWMAAASRWEVKASRYYRAGMASSAEQCRKDAAACREYAAQAARGAP